MIRALLFPQSVSMPTLIKEVSEVSHMLANECFAERYALTLRLMLSSLRRKTGAMSTVPGSPRYTSGQNGEQLPFDPNAFETEGLNSLLSLPQAGTEGNEIGNLNVENWNFDQELENFSWPTEFSPSNLPTWLQDGVSFFTTPHTLLDADNVEFRRSGITSRWIRFIILTARVSLGEFAVRE